MPGSGQASPAHSPAVARAFPDGACYRWSSRDPFGSSPHFLQIFNPAINNKMCLMALDNGQGGKTLHAGMAFDSGKASFSMYGKDVTDQVTTEQEQLVCIQTYSLITERQYYLGIEFVVDESGLIAQTFMRPLEGPPGATTYRAALAKPELMWIKRENDHEVKLGSNATFTLHPRFSTDVVLCVSHDTNRLCLLPTDKQGEAMTEFSWVPLKC
ncbi:uncharacterized protein LOC135812188 [Sycon ciliatum]|uniref:uncharacterized protein LOC135812188 n=1 Tax=Sycon ciliatum TaxID=27933 RepID=UPI0031F6F41E